MERTLDLEWFTSSLHQVLMENKILPISYKLFQDIEGNRKLPNTFGEASIDLISVTVKDLLIKVQTYVPMKRNKKSVSEIFSHQI